MSVPLKCFWARVATVYKPLAGMRIPLIIRDQKNYH